MPSLDMITGPDVEPVTLDEAKLWLKVDNADEDAELTAMISDAREAVELATSKRLVTQTWRWTIDLTFHRGGVVSAVHGDDGRVPERYGDKMIRSGFWLRHQASLDFPVRPVQAIEAVTYRAGGQDVDYDPALMRSLPSGELIFLPTSVPPLPDEVKGAITFTCRCGYGDAAADVPPLMKRAIKELCAHWYEYRGVYLEASRGRLPTDEMVWSVTSLTKGMRRRRI